MKKLKDSTKTPPQQQQKKNKKTHTNLTSKQHFLLDNTFYIPKSQTNIWN